MSHVVLTIGTLAERSSVGVETIRFYEREGLLPKPARTMSGYRSYPEDAIDRVLFIRRAKELGLPMVRTVIFFMSTQKHLKNYTTKKRLRWNR